MGRGPTASRERARRGSDAHHPEERIRGPQRGELRIKRPSPQLIVFALWLLVFSSASQTMILSPILPQIGNELGIEAAVLGTLVSAYSLMVGIFAVISGPISDRIGRRRILLLGTGVMALALSLHVFIADYASFLVLRMLAGIAGGVLSGSAVSYIGDWFPYDRRGWATGWVMSGGAFGQVSRPGESHPQALAEPYLNVSAHTAPIIRLPDAPLVHASGRTSGAHDGQCHPANVRLGADALVTS